jgi:two-component system CheB/CheR fusion protein
MGDHDDPKGGASRQIRDELEQLQTSLESAVEENARLAEDRDRLLVRVNALSEELRSAYARQSPAVPETPAPVPGDPEQEEQLRVAFEELQVLTEELEVANTTLHQANEELDARVEQRTRELAKANVTLRATEMSFRAITDLVPDLLWRADSAGEIDWFNRRWFEYTGHDERRTAAEMWSEALHPLDREGAQEAWLRAMASGEAYECEHRLRNGQGGYRWFLARAEPIRDDRRRITGWYAAGTDIHDQRMTRTALEQSEQRFRTLIEGMPQLVWRAIGGGKWTWSSPQWSEYTGQPAEESYLVGWLQMVHPEDRRRVLEAWAQASEVGLLEVQARLYHGRDGRYRHFHTRALPVRDDDGREAECLGTSTDIDDIVQLQARQSVLVTELQHRTRNLLAVIQAIVRRTIKDSSSMAAFRECFDDRLMALARVQGLLSHRQAGQRVSFDQLLRGELSAHVSLDSPEMRDRVSTEGAPGVPLKSATVQTLGLALHELTTNAVKYGALSQQGGRLRVTWQVVGADDADKRLKVDWRESGVAGMPEPGASARGGGYGRELIEKALPHQLGARTSYALEPSGVHCTIEVAIPAPEAPRENAHG